VLSGQTVEIAQGVVDASSSLETAGCFAKDEGDIGALLLLLLLVVLQTEAGVRVGGQKSTLTTAGIAMGTANG
jgi:hypothetical protein